LKGYYKALRRILEAAGCTSVMARAITRSGIERDEVRFTQKSFMVSLSNHEAGPLPIAPILRQAQDVATSSG
jgi:hypothetical protein